MKFTQADFDIFYIPDFRERMAALRGQIQPKLRELGEELRPDLEKALQIPLHLHVAKHLRRTVNPPDETWLALGPVARGYKAYVYFAACIGQGGLSARVVMKDESTTRPAMGREILKQVSRLSRDLSELELRNFTRGPTGKGEVFASLSEDLKAQAERLQRVKGAVFDVGVGLKTKAAAGPAYLKTFERLAPLFRCGL